MINDTGLTLNFQLHDQQLNLRYVPPATAVVKVTFNNADGTTFQKTGSFIDPLDQSLIKVQLVQADMAQLLDGNLNFTVDVLGDGSNVINGIIYCALQQIIQSVSIM